MLLLKDIKKDYQTGNETVNALKGVSISFRKSEFVSILGQSGCGKTTLLNIIGGLDRYTSGDLVINGVSTKDYQDSDWDTYRNHSIGFVFQSYNLITHQTVLANVELALTLSGVSKEERRERAIKALQRVGLGDQLKKKPTQMSGGQMQRVAIARALVNDPDILLADEPTGALDSATSVQIMEILKEIAKEKLVIMVTHNGELAEEYSTRIIRLHDGLVTSDTNPYTEEELKKDEAKEKKGNYKKNKKGMSFLTALSLSFNNLMTKKGRTILTAFAGSIGIIGIALILSLSTGIKGYIDQVQEETLSSYPVYIQEETTDLSSMLNGFMQAEAESGKHDLDKVYSNSTVFELFNSLNKLGNVKNNLKKFRTYLTENKSLHAEYISAIQYSYNLDLNILHLDQDNKVIQSNPSNIMDLMMEVMMGGTTSSMANNPYADMMGGGMQNNFVEIIPANDGGYVNEMLFTQYDVVYGNWPNAYDEMVLIVNENNEISDLALYSLGLRSQAEFKKMLENWSKDKVDIDVENSEYSYDDILKWDFRLVLPTDFYEENGPLWLDKSGQESFMTDLYHKKATKLKITGIIRPKEGATATALSGSIGYTYKLTEWYINAINNSGVVAAQKNKPLIDITTGKEFETDANRPSTRSQKLELIYSHLNSIVDTDTKVKEYVKFYSTPDDKEVEELYNAEYGRLSDEEFILQFAQFLLKMDRDGKYNNDIENAKKEVLEMGIDNARAYHKYFMLSYVDGTNLKEPYYVTTIKVKRSMALNSVATTPEQKILYIEKWLNGENEDKTMNADDYKISFIYENFVPSKYSKSTYEDNLKKFGVVDLESPSGISIYAKDFHSKEKISNLIDDYNKGVSEDDQISYTDYVALMMSGISTIIDAISYVLIGFVSISLIVSSIMIGIITYISVLERTKEIGILRAIGASKRDVSRVFTAETIIEGLAAGLIGIVATILICIPINLILYALSGIPGLKAELPFIAAVILVLISVLLTLIAGYFPSRIAAKKDPVEALRTE